MQRPSKVTPTKIPSLGVIVRLVSFTGASPGNCMQGAIGGLSRATVEFDRFAPVTNPFRRSTGGGNAVIRRRPAWSERLIGTLGSRSHETPGLFPGGLRNGLRGADLGQEFVDRATQHAGLIVEFTGVRQHVRGRRAGGRRRRGDAANVGADLVRSGRDRLDVARDLAGRIALLFDRGG